MTVTLLNTPCLSRRDSVLGTMTKFPETQINNKFISLKSQLTL